MRSFHPGDIDFGIAPDFLRLFLFFCLASFAGWILESAYRSVCERRWVNSGFLRGPFVPVYGFGAVAILAMDQTTSAMPFLPRWALLLILPTLVEFLAGFVMEKALKMKLWDYEGKFLNVCGYVCLAYSLMWAFLVVADVRFVQPLFVGAASRLSDRSLYLVSGALASYLAVDTWQSVAVYADFKRVFSQLGEAIAKGKVLPFQATLRGARPSLEWRRFLRPLGAFPGLLRKAQALERGLPHEIVERMSRLRSSILRKPAKEKGDGRKDA